MTAKTPENAVNFKTSLQICFSDNGFFAISSLTNVIGASFSSVDFSLKSSTCLVGLLISLCSTIFFTLERNKNELITAGKIAIAAITST